MRYDRLKDALRTDLLNRRQGYPDPWQPSGAGAVLIGTLKAVDRSVPTPYGPADVALIEREDTGQRVALWLSHAVLKRAFAEAAPRRGDRVGIVYLGKRTARSGYPYHDYALRVDPAPRPAPLCLN